MVPRLWPLLGRASPSFYCLHLRRGSFPALGMQFPQLHSSLHYQPPSEAPSYLVGDDLAAGPPSQPSPSAVCLPMLSFPPSASPAAATQAADAAVLKVADAKAPPA